MFCCIFLLFRSKGTNLREATLLYLLGICLRIFNEIGLSGQIYKGKYGLKKVKSLLFFLFCKFSPWKSSDRKKMSQPILKLIERGLWKWYWKFCHTLFWHHNDVIKLTIFVIFSVFCIKKALKVLLMTKNYILAIQIILYLKGNLMRITNLVLKILSDVVLTS